MSAVNQQAKTGRLNSGGTVLLQNPSNGGLRRRRAELPRQGFGTNLERLLKVRFNFCLHIVGQLGAIRTKQFDAIVVVGVVGGADHNSGAGAQLVGQLRDGRGGLGPSSMTWTPAADRPASSADSNMYPDCRVSLPIRMRGLSRPSPSTRQSPSPGAIQIRGHRRDTDAPTNAVGAKVRARHGEQQ